MSNDAFDFRAILFDYFYKYFSDNDLAYDDVHAILEFLEFCNFSSFKGVLNERFGVLDEKRD